MEAWKKLGAGLAVAALVLAGCGSADDVPSETVDDSNDTAGVEDSENGEADAGADDSSDDPAADYEPVELSYAAMHGPGSPWTTIANAIMDDIEERTDGGVTFERFHTEELCAAPEISPCIQDGRADMGQTVPGYTPTTFRLPEIAGIPFVTSDKRAATAAFATLASESEDWASESEAAGLKMLALFPIGPVLLGAQVPVDSSEDFENLSVRSIGPGADHALNEIGGNPVALGGLEIYEGLQRGVADAWLNTLDGAEDLNFDEVTSHFRETGYGIYTTFGVWINQDTFEGLPEPAREVILEVFDEYTTGGRAMDIHYAHEADACERLLDRGGLESFSVWDSEETARWAEITGDVPRNAWLENASQAGVSDPEALLDRYLEIVGELEDPSGATPTSECAQQFNG